MSVNVRAIPTAVRRRLADGPLYYGWYIVGAIFVIDIITWGTIWSFGVFFGYLVEEFDLSHANTSVIFSLQSIVTFGGAAVLGFVIDRYGAQRLLLVAVALVVAGLFGVSQLGSFSGMLVSYGLVVASGFAIVNVIDKATPSRWFDRRRGLATGIALAGAGVGIFLFPPIVEVLIRDLGWRGAYGSLLLAFLATYVVAAVVVLDRPNDLELDPSREFPDGMPDETSTGGDWRSQLEDAVTVARTPAFGLVFLSILFLSAAAFVMLVSVVEFTTNAGLGREIGVLALSVIGGMNIVGKIVGGAASDRIGRPVTFAVSGVFMGGGLFTLLGLLEPVGVFAGAVSFGFGWGIQVGLMGPLVADLFGTLSINTLVGLILATAAISGSIGPYLAGLTFDLFGTYEPVFLAAGLISVLGGGLALAAVRLRSGNSFLTMA